MPFIDWSDKLSVGHPTIDSQHQKLVEMLNTLNDAMADRKGNDVLGGIFTGLVEYTVTHFQYEEGQMDLHKYPDAVNHKAEHKKLTEKALDLKKQFDEDAMLISVQVMSFLRDWLQNHIQNVDKKLGDYLSSK